MKDNNKIALLAIQIRDISQDLFVYAKTLSEDEPTYLNFLEKRYNDLHEIAEKLDVINGTD